MADVYSVTGSRSRVRVVEVPYDGEPVIAFTIENNHGRPEAVAVAPDALAEALVLSSPAFAKGLSELVQRALVMYTKDLDPDEPSAEELASIEAEFNDDPLS